LVPLSHVTGRLDITKTLPISKARTRLPYLVEAASRTMDRVIITRNGNPEAVLMGHEEFESWARNLGGPA
jgi:prevent-host-death family protein